MTNCTCDTLPRSCLGPDPYCPTHGWEADREDLEKKTSDYEKLATEVTRLYEYVDHCVKYGEKEGSWFRLVELRIRLKDLVEKHAKA